MILDLLRWGMSHDEILADYPDLEREDILAVLEHRRGGSAAAARIHARCESDPVPAAPTPERMMLVANLIPQWLPSRRSE